MLQLPNAVNAENVFDAGNMQGGPQSRATTKTPLAKDSSRGALRTPLGGMTNLGSQAKGMAGAPRTALGDISNRAQKQSMQSTAMSSTPLLTGAAADLALPPIERMHPCQPSAPGCLDGSLLQLETEVEALIARAPCILGATHKPTVPDVLQHPDLLDENPPLPTANLSLTYDDVVVPFCPQAPAAARLVVLDELSDGTTPSDSDLDVSLDISALVLLPSALSEDNGSDDNGPDNSDEGGDEGGAENDDDSEGLAAREMARMNDLTDAAASLVL